MTLTNKDKQLIADTLDCIEDIETKLVNSNYLPEESRIELQEAMVKAREVVAQFTYNLEQSKLLEKQHKLFFKKYKYNIWLEIGAAFLAAVIVTVIVVVMQVILIII